MVHPEQGNVPPAQPPVQPPEPAYFPPGKASVPTQPVGYPEQTGYPLEYAGTPYAPPPRRRTGVAVAIGAVVIVVALAALVGIGYVAYTVVSNAAGGRGLPTGAPNPTTGPATRPSTPTSAPTTAPRSTVFDGDLRTLLVPRPSGAQPWSNLKNSDGNLNLNGVADLFSNDAEMRDDLQSFHFKRAAVMHWSQDNTYVLILLFQFDSARDAGDYLAKTKKAGLKNFDAKGEFGGVTGSLLYVDDTPNSQNQRTTIFISAQHEIVAYTTVWHPGQIDLDGATALAVTQHKRLP